MVFEQKTATCEPWCTSLCVHMANLNLNYLREDDELREPDTSETTERKRNIVLQKKRCLMTFACQSDSCMFMAWLASVVGLWHLPAIGWFDCCPTSRWLAWLAHTMFRLLSKLLATAYKNDNRIFCSLEIFLEHRCVNESQHNKVGQLKQVRWVMPGGHCRLPAALVSSLAICLTIHLVILIIDYYYPVLSERWFGSFIVFAIPPRQCNTLFNC